LKEAEMKKNRLYHLLVIALLFVLTACQGAGQSLGATLSEPGKSIDGMSLTTGAADAVPLWAYCSPSEENTHIRTFDCRAPVWQTLAIGHLFLLADSANLTAGGADLTWELSIDDYLVDLESFGTFDYVMPAMPKGPSPIREVFVNMTDWNLVMTNLNPGEHILFFRAQDGEGYYHVWLVRLAIEDDGKNRTDINSVPFQPKL
jgi:hypothetical protein